VKVALVARRLERMRAVARECESWGVEALVCEVDLLAPGAAAEIASTLRDKEVGLIVNNAGMWDVGRFWETDLVRQRAMVQLHCLAPLELSHHFLQQMVPRKRGAIVTVSSTATYHRAGLMSAYAASKAFDLKFGRALAAELRGTGVDSIVVLPGTTNTEIFEAAGVRLPGSAFWQKPEAVARKTLSALGKRDSVLIAPAVERIFLSACRLFPGSMGRLAAAGIRSKVLPLKTVASQ
jgi:uncharacterized protein